MTRVSYNFAQIEVVCNQCMIENGARVKGRVVVCLAMTSSEKPNIDNLINFIVLIIILSRSFSFHSNQELDVYCCVPVVPCFQILHYVSCFITCHLSNIQHGLVDG